MSTPKMGPAIPAASGYPQYSGNLITPLFGQRLIEEFYATTVFGEISTTDYIGELVGRGDMITFWREPNVSIRDHVKDGIIKSETLESKPVTLTIDRAKEFSFKIADVDKHMMQQWDAMKNAAMRSASREAARAIDCEMLSTIYADADPANSGCKAGVCSGCYDMGEVGSPLAITKDNVLDILINAGAVLDEQNIPKENRYIVIPPKMKVALLTSDLAKAYCSGLSLSTYINGKIPEQLAGFDIYVSNHLAPVQDPITNAMSYNLTFGWKGSTVFAADLEKTRQITTHESWDTYYQGLMVYGFGVIQPEALGHMYATF